MIFKVPVFLSLFGITLLGTLVIFYCVTIQPSHRALYEQIVQQTKALYAGESLERHPSTQIRKNAKKDIWTYRGEERVHFQMHSDLSKLTVKQKKDKVEASEELENITCMNAMGTLIANKGAYDYPDQNFIARQVKCTHSLGHLKAETATLEEQTLVLNDGVSLSSPDFILHSQKAICEETTEDHQIEFFQDIDIKMNNEVSATGDFAQYKTGFLTLRPQDPNGYCHLHRLGDKISAHEMHFDLKGENVLCHHAIGTLRTLQFRAETLFYEKELITLTDQIHLSQENDFHLDADLCIITLNEQKPTCIEMKNNVRLFSPTIQEKDTFAVADQIVFYPDKQTLILTSVAPKRVLFWQEGVRLSAPEIHIQKEFIQGKGDVRFTFNLDEQNIIDQFISKYL